MLGRDDPYSAGAVEADWWAPPLGRPETLREVATLLKQGRTPYGQKSARGGRWQRSFAVKWLNQYKGFVAGWVCDAFGRQDVFNNGKPKLADAHPTTTHSPPLGQRRVNCGMRGPVHSGAGCTKNTRIPGWAGLRIRGRDACGSSVGQRGDARGSLYSEARCVAAVLHSDAGCKCIRNPDAKGEKGGPHPHSGCKRQEGGPDPPARPLLASECGMRARAHSGASGCEIGLCIQAGDAERKYHHAWDARIPFRKSSLWPISAKHKNEAAATKKARQNTPQIAVPKGTGNRPRGAARLQCVSSAVRPAAHASRPV